MVSVCIATYNGERFIKKQLESILNQLSENDEIIISDDGSTDNTIEIINSFNDNRIHLYFHSKESVENSIYNSFIYATRNFANALSKANGEYIFLADQDDIWMENKLKKGLEFLSEYDCVVHNYQKIDEQDKVFQKKAFIKNPLHKSLLMNTIDNHFRGCCMSFRAEFLNDILPIPTNVIGHDYWIGALICKKGNVYYDLEPRLQSRWYPGSVSAKRKTSLLYKIKFRLNLYIELRKRLRGVKK